MKTLIQITIATLLTWTAVAEDIHTIADVNGSQHLPAADFVVVIEKNTASIYNAGGWGEPLAVGKTPKMPADKNGLRAFTLGLLVQAVNDKSIWVIIDDHYKPSKAGAYYKAYIKRVSPEDVWGRLPWPRRG